MLMSLTGLESATVFWVIFAFFFLFEHFLEVFYLL